MIMNIDNLTWSFMESYLNLVSFSEIKVRSTMIESDDRLIIAGSFSGDHVNIKLVNESSLSLAKKRYHLSIIIQEIST